jgi:hypothetical protein
LGQRLEPVIEAIEKLPSFQATIRKMQRRQMTAECDVVLVRPMKPSIKIGSLGVLLRRIQILCRWGDQLC